MSEPETASRGAVKPVAVKWFWRIALTALFGPFAVIYALGFLGMPLPGGWFGAWFMGALTIAGIVTTIDLAHSVRLHGAKELGCVLPIAAVTCWWGYVFLKELGLVK